MQAKNVMTRNVVTVRPETPVAAESTPGVKAVEDNVSVFSPSVRAAMWAE